MHNCFENDYYYFICDLLCESFSMDQSLSKIEINKINKILILKIVFKFCKVVKIREGNLELLNLMYESAI